MKKYGKALSVGAVAVAVLLGSSTAAYAGRDAKSTIEGSYTEFHSNGDKFYNCDTDYDLFTAYVDYSYIRKDGSVQKGKHYNPGGRGDCATFDHDFGEGRPVQFRSCVDVPIGIDPCDRWREGIA
ncbi:hypothetical protein [Actinomadura decatromicini]|uniref:Secreted protein n=1 Tax=Actinomadura decatromicini TaxID=2604572 RepID=A0A5D3FX63_9ACTN|nr:hypothetical protein [Actinomadura decatromicini]TYK52602.1 hypothetical protein FXF68_02190 [Actinomadura decatromicini]